MVSLSTSKSFVVGDINKLIWIILGNEKERRDDKERREQFDLVAREIEEECDDGRVLDLLDDLPESQVEEVLSFSSDEEKDFEFDQTDVGKGGGIKEDYVEEDEEEIYIQGPKASGVEEEEEEADDDVDDESEEDEGQEKEGRLCDLIQDYLLEDAESPKDEDESYFGVNRVNENLSEGEVNYLGLLRDYYASE
jgi:hypothetical protein